MVSDPLLTIPSDAAAAATCLVTIALWPRALGAETRFVVVSLDFSGFRGGESPNRQWLDFGRWRTYAGGRFTTNMLEQEAKKESSMLSLTSSRL